MLPASPMPLLIVDVILHPLHQTMKSVLKKYEEIIRRTGPKNSTHEIGSMEILNSLNVHHLIMT